MAINKYYDSDCNLGVLDKVIEESSISLVKPSILERM